jgi:hypothetical protein
LPVIAVGSEGVSGATPGSAPILTLSSGRSVANAGKARRENPSFEIPAELTFDMGWAGSALAAIAGEFEPGDEVRRCVCTVR